MNAGFKSGKLAFGLIFIFLAGVIDIPVWLLPAQASPKTCCGRVICTCKHGKGAHCPYKSMAKSKNSLIHSFTKLFRKSKMPKMCHLPVKKAAAPAKKIQPSQLPAGVLMLTEAPCSPAQPKSLLPRPARDFLTGSFRLDSYLPQTFNTLHAFYDRPLLSARSDIFHPPRTVSFSF